MLTEKPDREFFDAGPLTFFLSNVSVTNIFCNGLHEKDKSNREKRLLKGVFFYCVADFGT